MSCKTLPFIWSMIFPIPCWCSYTGWTSAVAQSPSLPRDAERVCSRPPVMFPAPPRPVLSGPSCLTGGCSTLRCAPAVGLAHLSRPVECTTCVCSCDCRCFTSSSSMPSMITFPAPPRPVEYILRPRDWERSIASGGSREREREEEVMFPAPPRPVD